MNWDSVLNWAVTGGFVAGVSWFASWILEDVAWWANVKSQYKKLAILGVALVLGIGSTYLKQNEALLVAVKPYLEMGTLTIGAWLATQVAHKADKA